MDKKIIAVAVVAVILVAAVGVYFMTQGNDSDDSMSVIGRVNTDGSGIILKAGEKAEDYVTIVNGSEPKSGYYLGGNGTWVVFNKDSWGGKVFTDPGAATIQHVQLSTIASTMGLNFKMYTNDTKVSEDTLYYVPGVGTYDLFKSNLNTTPAIVGGIFWEPQSSVAVMDKCVLMTVTNQIFPGHTCCTVAAQHGYIASHEDETIRFLAAYIESVNKMTAAIEAGSGEAYDKVIAVALDKVSMPASMDKEQKIQAIESAFTYVVYKYADSKDASVSDPLADLKKDIANMANEFYSGGLVKNNATDLGFDSYSDMADKFVQSQFIKKAMNYEKEENYKTANITVAVIGGDIHQLAIHYGMAMGIFEDYGISITISSQSNGPAVYTAMKNGDSQFGFIGAPPMTINSMNDKTI